MKIQFVPHRGFAITLRKVCIVFCIIMHIIFNIRKWFMSAYCFSVQSDDELKGAHGYTPRKASQVRLYTWTMWYFEHVHAFLISCSICVV